MKKKFTDPSCVSEVLLYSSFLQRNNAITVTISIHFITQNTLDVCYIPCISSSVVVQIGICFIGFRCILDLYMIYAYVYIYIISIE